MSFEEVDLRVPQFVKKDNRKSREQSSDSDLSDCIDEEHNLDKCSMLNAKKSPNASKNLIENNSISPYSNLRRL